MSGLNLSFGLSVGFHAAMFGLYIFLMMRMPKIETTIVSDVDILVPARPERAAVAPASRTEPPTTWNFLKMALPQLPAAARPTEPQIESAVPRRMEMPQPLQEQSGRLPPEAKPDMRLALSPKGMALLEAEAKNVTERPDSVPLADSIDLEEVGARRAPALPQELLAENTGLPSFKPQSLQEVKAFMAQAKGRAVVSAAPLQPEAAGGPADRTSAGKISGMFSAPTLSMEESGGPGGGRLARPVAGPVVQVPAAAREKPAALKTASDAPRRMEIVGPLSQRKIVKAHVPPFPDWARERGILEAAVSIRFYVSREGRVLEEMRVERSSGYGALDRLAVDALKQWVFAPAESGAGQEWGIITFVFLLE